MDEDGEAVWDLHEPTMLTPTLPKRPTFLESLKAP